MKKMNALLEVLLSYEPESQWATDENGETFCVEDDPYLDRLITGHRLLRPDVSGQVCDNPPGHCHQAVAYILTSERQPGDVLYTGFALDTDEWFTHSFIVNKDQIVEPGSRLFKSYVGIQLQADEEKSFLDAWSQ